MDSIVRTIKFDISRTDSEPFISEQTVNSLLTPLS